MDTSVDYTDSDGNVSSWGCSVCNLHWHYIMWIVTQLEMQVSKVLEVCKVIEVMLVSWVMGLYLDIKSHNS